jgi:hypothetical protein
MVRSKRVFWRRPYCAEPPGWAGDKVWPLKRGPMKSIVSHLSSSGGGTWSFVGCGKTYGSTKIQAKSWFKLSMMMHSGGNLWGDPDRIESK